MINRRHRSYDYEAIAKDYEDGLRIVDIIKKNNLSGPAVIYRAIDKVNKSRKFKEEINGRKNS